VIDAMEEQSLKCRLSGVDILLTHELSDAEHIRLALDVLKPCYHFFGHVRRPCNPFFNTNGVTVSARLADLGWEESRGRPLRRGTMGILHWHNNERRSFGIVDEPWLLEYTAHSWRH